MSIKATLKILITMIKRNILLSVLLVFISFISIYMVDESVCDYLYNLETIVAFKNTYSEKTEDINTITQPSSDESKVQQHYDFLGRMKEVDKIKYYGKFGIDNFFPENFDLPDTFKERDMILVQTVITEPSMLDLGNFYLTQEEKNILKNHDDNIYPIFIGSDMKDFLSLGDILTFKHRDEKFIVAGVLKKGANAPSRWGIGAYSDTLMDTKMLVCVEEVDKFINDTSDYIYYVCDEKDNEEVSSQLRKLSKECDYDIWIENKQESIQSWRTSNGMSDNKRFIATVMLLFLAIISVTTVVTAMCMMKTREYGIMYTIGVTFGDIKKLIILYDILVVLFGSVCAWLLKNYKINEMYPNNGKFEFYRNMWITTHNIIMPVLILICGCVIVLAASYVPLKIMKRKNPAEMIKKGSMQIKASSVKVFRYQFVSICFIVGQLIAYIAVFGALQIYNSAIIKENERKNAIYAYRITAQVSVSGKDILSQANKGVNKGNILLSGRMSVACEQTNGLNNRAELLLKISEELPYKVISGHIPGTQEEDLGKRVVAVGRKQYRNAVDKNGKKYLTYCMEEYEVVGVLGSESDYWDNRVVFHIDFIGERTLNYILDKENNFEIHIDSNNYTTDELKEEYDTLYTNIVNADNMASVHAIVDTSEGEETISSTYYQENIRVNYIVYIFCLINNVIISYFWIISRRKEIAVRQTFGYSKLRLAGMLVKDMAIMLITALAFFITVYLLGKNWFNQYLNVYIKLDTLGELAGILILTTIISVLYPIYRVMKMQNAQAVNVE